MPPPVPVSLFTLAIMAAIGIGVGIYHLFNDPNEEEHLHNGPRPRPNNPRPLRTSSPPRPWASPPRRPAENAPAIATSQSSGSLPSQSASSSSRNGVRRRTREPLANCSICKDPMADSKTVAQCGHIFHKECYTIWKHMMDEYGVDRICPQCPRSATQSL